MAQNEITFQVDLDGDGHQGFNLTTLETNGDYKLAQANTQYYIIDSSSNKIPLAAWGKARGPNSYDGWSAIHAEESASGGFEVLWSHSDGRTWVWKTDTSGKYQSDVTHTVAQNEITFQVDLDGDGYVAIVGLDSNDILSGTDADDQIDGGTGNDTITTGSGADKIILRIGDGGTELMNADIITDFTDGSDNFGLTNGLSFDDLTRAQGTGSYFNDTIISYGTEYLAILQNIDVSLLTEADFETVDIA